MLVLPWVLLPITPLGLWVLGGATPNGEKKTSWSYKTKQENGGGRKHMTNLGNEQYCVYKVSVFVSSKWWTEKKKKKTNYTADMEAKEGKRKRRREGEIDVLCPVSVAAVAIR